MIRIFDVGLVAWRWLAAEDSPSKPAWDTFAQYGVLGVAVVALAWFVHKLLSQMWDRNAAELAREVARADRLEAENRGLNLAMQDKAVPTLLAAANALTECTELLRELQRDRERERERERDYARRRGEREVR